MSFDLTNKNISDTFQNLLQKTGSEGHLYDLKGNKVENLTETLENYKIQMGKYHKIILNEGKL